MHDDPLVGLSMDSTLEKPSSAKEIKISVSLKWSYGLVILGLLFDVVSALLPWCLSLRFDYVFLPYSPVWGDYSYTLPLEVPFITINVLVYAAAIVGWVSVIFSKRLKRGQVLYGAVLVSGVLSLTAFVLFTQILSSDKSLYLSWGAYLALISGVLQVSGVLMKILKIEVVITDSMPNLC